MATENVPSSFHVPTTLDRNISNMYLHSELHSDLYSDFKKETYLLVFTSNNTDANCNMLWFV